MPLYSAVGIPENCYVDFLSASLPCKLSPQRAILKRALAHSWAVQFPFVCNFIQVMSDITNITIISTKQLKSKSPKLEKYPPTSEIQVIVNFEFAKRLN